ncbi:hypothetical protein Z043_124823, partial [Scleropages formosus]
IYNVNLDHLPVNRCSQDDKEKKRLEALERKRENQRLLEEENAKLKGRASKDPMGGKVTRAQIEETLRNEQKQQQQQEVKEKGILWPEI